ncbi:alpha/beta fold hydrolase [Telmatocola sphagniphila]|uniref:Alpha/beta fold hydrolase n=1 Tax=Telmatocola sphagniphila TaxID=1123043 RepID=A0A8E6B5W3_9BACT|nr:alpha/beta fold hydrolase [Telmatocola sphagniphila]QVL32472.1 alpha/beta fold hydrolase [Telmatocola sphagniphila]
MFSGMEADERLFDAQRQAFPNLKVCRWIEPLPGDSLRAYAARLAPLVDPGEPCILGGASFGGIIAQELSRHIRAQACIIIGSISSPSGIPLKWRMLRPLAHLPLDRLNSLFYWISKLGRPIIPYNTRRRLLKLSRPEAAFVLWAMCSVLKWRPPSAPIPTRLFHLHGALDRVFPVHLSKPDLVVPAGGHALTLFCPTAVNDYISFVRNEVGG